MANPSEMLDAIDAAIAQLMANGGVVLLTIGGKTVQFQRLDELRNLRREYQGLADAAALGAGRVPKPLRCRFGRAR